ncbi:MAG: hypothetical protein KBE65_12700 [Phycisphaerae bacterium]|nr:hypothetical protein [Phycisphaerae bacterium]
MEQPVTITGLTLFITVVLSILTLAVPRRYALLPYVIGACWVPADQRIMVGELDFQVIRVLVVMGILRLWLRSETVRIRWNRFDKLFLAWVLVGDLIYVLQWMSMGALIFKCGQTFTALGLYWVFRQITRSWADQRMACVALGVCAVAMAPFVALEWVTGSNPFGALGRVTTLLREGNFRAQATFPHAIMMGLFWATLVPLFVGFSKQGHKTLFWLAIGACAFMIFGSNSSTPILTLAAVVGLLLCYRWRRNAGKAAWAALILAFALHLVMKAPVWHLLARVSVVSGSTGWHRYYLVDSAIRHFSEWMLLGTRDTAHWGMGLQDVTNQYVLEGVRGGLITLVLFCAILIVAGRALVRLSLHPRDKRESYLAWCCFVCLIGHCVSFLGVSYFGQIMLIWYFLLALVGYCYDRAYAKTASVARKSPPVASTACACP